ncbi:MAG: WD40 repeat domain-containing protein [Desulfobacterales bacterium]|nr:WD40 repeat domain-containing protein [Desulfobacterales bacterium]
MKKTIILIGVLVVLICSGYLLVVTIFSTQIDPNFFKSIDIDQSKSFESNVTAIAYNKKKALLSIGYESGNVDIFDGKNATKYMSIQPVSTRSNILNFSQDGKYLSVGTYFEDTTYIYDIENKALFMKLENTGGTELFTSNNRCLIMANRSEIRLYDFKKNIWLGSYKTDGVVESLSLNDNETLLAVGTNNKIQLFAFYQPPWYKRIFDKKSPAALSLKTTAEAHTLKDWILYSWFIDNALVTLSRFANLYVWSIPDLKKIKDIPLKSNTIRGAVFGKNKRYIMALGVNEDREKEQYFEEQIDLNLNKSEILTRINTNYPNIAKWSESQVNENNELIFVEHAGKKILLRLGPTPENQIKSNYKKYVGKYLAIPKNFKAFAVAKGASGRYEGNYTWGQSSQSIADQKALEECQERVKKTNINANCYLKFQGDKMLGD